MNIDIIKDLFASILYFFFEKIIYVVSCLINEIHLEYFIYPITFLLTIITTGIIILCLKIFGINDNIENDKIILGLNRKNNDKIESDEEQ